MTPSDRRTSRATGGDYTLRILATSDIHAHLMPYDYTWDQPLLTAGLVRTASLIRKARAGAANCLLLDNGDFLQGSALGEVAASGELAFGGPHPVIAAMNLIGYDAATLGNHDFSFGLPFLEQALSGARFPVVCANAVRALGPEPLSDKPFCPPALILERKLTADCGQAAPIRIGVFGVLPPQVAIWEGTQIAGQIQTRDILMAARAWVGHLRDRGAELIIALCHSGIGASEAQEGMENAAVPLAALEGIDVVIAGHIHRPFPDREYAPSPVIDGVRGSLCRKPAVMAGFWGSHLGQIDLKLAIREGRWTIRSHRARALPIARRTAKGRLLPLAENDPVIAAAVEPVHRAVLAQVRQPIGRTDIALHSYFARLCDCAAMQLVHAAQLAWLDDWAKESPLAGLPRISAASPFKSGGRGGPLNFTDIAAGDLERRHVNDLYTFPNAIRVVMVTGRILGDWLERSASQFHRLEAGVLDQPLFDADSPSYNFDSLSGISYEIDATRPARFNAQGDLADPRATRVRNVCHKGRALAPDMKFLVVTNSFRAAGGGQFAGLGPHVTVAEPLTPNCDVIRRHISINGQVAPRAAHNWRLAALPDGTGAWFDTGPRAVDHLGDDTGWRIEPMGMTPAGFLRCRVLPRPGLHSRSAATM